MIEFLGHERELWCTCARCGARAQGELYYDEEVYFSVQPDGLFAHYVLTLPAGWTGDIGGTVYCKECNVEAG